MLPLETIAFLVTGAMLGGLVMGLVGFGVGLAALGFWLFVLDPAIAVPLVCITSLATTAFTFRAYWHAVSLDRLAPFLLGAAAGLPVGVLLLTRLDPALFKLAMGVFLVAYTLFRLLMLPHLVIRRANRFADGLVGAAGGLFAGFAAVPGPLSTVWCGLRGWSKDEQRGVYQPFNQSLLLVALAGYWLEGLLTRELLRTTLYCVPAAYAGLALGIAGYKRLDETQFQRLVLLLLLASGLILITLNLVAVTRG